MFLNLHLGAEAQEIKHIGMKGNAYKCGLPDAPFKYIRLSSKINLCKRAGRIFMHWSRRVL